MGATQYLKNQITEALRGTPFYIPDGYTYLALFSTAPIGDMAGSEPGDPAYARQPMQITPFIGGSDPGNFAPLIFPEATVKWPTVSWYGVFTAQTGGNMLFSGTLSSPKSAEVGDQFRVPMRGLKISFPD